MDLLTRLQEQTAACRQLQEELDGYEWYEEEEEEGDGNTTTVKANGCGDSATAPKYPSRPASARSHHGGYSRPSSTRFDFNKRALCTFSHSSSYIKLIQLL